MKWRRLLLTVAIAGLALMASWHFIHQEIDQHCEALCEPVAEESLRDGVRAGLAYGAAQRESVMELAQDCMQHSCACPEDETVVKSAP